MNYLQPCYPQTTIASRCCLPTETGTHSSTHFEDVYEYLRVGWYLSTAKNAKIVMRRKAESFALQDGTLYYHGGNMENLRRLVQDRTEQQRLVEACHVGIGDTKEARAMGSHFGRTRTLQKLTTRYYWKGMKTDVENLVGSKNYLVYICKIRTDILSFRFSNVIAVSGSTKTREDISNSTSYSCEG